MTLNKYFLRSFLQTIFMEKLELINQVDISSRQAFKTFWDKVQMLFGIEFAFNFCSCLLHDPSQYYTYLTMDDQTLYQNLSVLISNDSFGSHSPSNMEIQTNKIKKNYPSNSQRINPQSQGDVRKMDIQQTPDCFFYFQKIKQNLKRDKQFSSNFKEEDFQEFLNLYLVYQQENVLDQSSIKSQCKKHHQKIDMDAFLKQLLLVDSALYYSSPRHRLYITQILAIYCFLYNPKLTKILLQILTGEGKSTTIACLAAILTMRGRNVDIITTNSILAKRDVLQKKKFFEILGLKVDHNIPPDSDKSNTTSLSPKKCYEKGTIVYGTPFSYQVDLLFDEYKRKGTRNGRPYDVAIIDEVDSMFIDEKSHQTLLASTFAGFADLALPMRIIWQNIAMSNIVKEEDKLFLFKHGKNQGQIIKGEANQAMKIIIDQIRKKFQNEIIPQWRMEFIQFSLEDWLWSAIQAAHIYKQDQHYIIEKDKIIPVDFRNTGCLQRNVHWENGLHQFLQIKHQLPISVESMTSNFMSNIGHFSRYRSIYGLTGTLGSDQSKRFLKKIYDVSMLDIPPYLERRLKIEDGYLMYSDSEWLEKIIENVEKMMNQQRSVLIICQTISDVKIIEMSIKVRCRSFKQIKTHQTGQQNHTDRIGCNQIIIATNVAGRGTDLKAQKQLIQKGGLHVIITFMPENLRVQMQARGRAGRNGAPGSSELIVNHKQYFDEMMKPPIQHQLFIIQGWEKQIKAVSKHIRDQYEALSMKKDIQKVEQLKTKDRIFSYFCQTVGKISDYQNNKAKRDALEEAWAMFLKKAEYLKLSMQEMQYQGKQLIDKFGENSEGFYNPSHSLWRGIDSIRTQNLQNAKGHFRELQKKDSTITNKISGKLMQSSLTIKMDDKKQKSNYGGALEQMASTLKLLQERKDIVKASHAVSLSANSRQISDMMKSQSKRKEREKLKTVLKKEDSNLKALNIGLINSTQIKKIPLNMNNSNRQSVNAMQQQQDLNINQYLKNGNQIQRQENNQSHQNIELIQNSGLASQERRNIEQAMNIPEVNVLNSIGQHVKKQIEKISQVSANQYAEITWEPLSSIIDITQGKEERTEQALQKVATDIPLLPVAEIKKIKVPWWKRVLVFALGVLQICLGALIVSASAGAAASFGAFMIQSGISDCMAAIFSPQVCDNLGKFYTKKALQYTMALATIGVQGMSQLASLSKNGFLTIKNSTMSQVMERAANGIKQGLIKGGFDWRGIVQKQIFEGISSKLTEHNKGSLNISPQQTFKAMKSGDLKNFIQQGSKEEDKIQKTGSQIRQRFQKGAESTINEIIATIYPNFLKQISSLKLEDGNIRILIEEQFKNAFHNFFYDKDRKQIYKEMLHFISANIKDENLAQRIIKEFKIDSLMKSTVEGIKNSENYQIAVHNSQIPFRQEIVEKVKEVNDRYLQTLKNELEAIKRQKNLIETTPLTQDQRNQRVRQCNRRVETYKVSEQNFNQFVTQFKELDQNTEIVKNLVRKGIIKGSVVDKNCAPFRNLHPYLIEALTKVMPRENSQKSFKQYLSATAYNSFAGIAIKALQEIMDNSSNSMSRLKMIQSRLYDQLQKN